MRKILSFFNREPKKSLKMDITEQNVEEIKNKFSSMEFQWIKGEYLSTMENYKNAVSSGDSIFIEFSSGRRINLDLLEEYLVYFPAQPRISQPSQPEQPVVNQSPAKKDSSVTAIVYDDNQYSKNSNEDSPIYKLLRKQKKNLVEVSIKLKLNLPSKELYGVLSTSFEDADKEIIEFVLDGVDIDDIKASLAQSIRSNYYSVEEKKKPATNNRNAKQ
jgi:hypothetical protein